MRITAAGSLPGTDFRGALSSMAEALPDVLPLPELPARGVASAMIGRTLGLIGGLAFDLQPAGWRLTHHPDAEHRRARAQWRHDLDDAEELLQGFAGTLKVAVTGPWTLASSVERPTGDRLLADHGARRELAEALVEAVAVLRGEFGRRLPDATVLVQVDEPALGAVVGGDIPTASGFSRHRSVSEADAVEALKPFADGALLHNCAPGRWLELARRAGFAGAAVDSRLADLDELAQWADERRTLVLGVVDTGLGQPQGVDALVNEALRVLRAIQAEGGDHLLLGTACGLAGWRQTDVVPQFDALARAASLTEELLGQG
ncbi:uroporphyrinogen decarboxylase family protein [Tessaracoccus sp. ZS01]|uniref:uroporphyrinogen decarboxylase family protein n=1 Tax=Tessaracoccus sp. ZS01 TaxID=1906324 RepID=UPI00096F4943|nr:uroporphyrinogen decarboxylase family protein [Tessaracoccus sp. ZS01]MCG6566351.1 methionine synthase [Tessaracoccus sp. ZS01]OMG58819.1 hypothetical protein BJN44_01715 [Tessaracoccus sp. ZS01]